MHNSSEVPSSATRVIDAARALSEAFVSIITEVLRYHLATSAAAKPVSPPRYYTPHEVANRLRISVATVKRRAVKLGIWKGRGTRFTEQEIEAITKA